MNKLIITTLVLLTSCNLPKMQEHRDYKRKMKGITKIEKIVNKYALDTAPVVIDKFISKPINTVVSFPVSVLMDTTTSQSIATTSGKTTITASVINDQIVIKSETEPDTNLKAKVNPPIIINPPVEPEPVRGWGVPWWVWVVVVLGLLLVFRRN